MKSRYVSRVVVFAALLVALALLWPSIAVAHCDGMDGPVVRAARKTLETGDLTHVLIWVGENDEVEVRRAFDKAMAVRKLERDARQLADLYFFETVVRLHRLGEGAPYTGLKPPGRDLGPAIPAADRAIESGSAERLQELLAKALRAGVQERFGRVLARKNFPAGDVKAGREFVKAYVEFLHYAEGAYQALHGHTGGHESH
jgi:hypothetical protein